MLASDGCLEDEVVGGVIADEPAKLFRLFDDDDLLLD